MITRRILLGQAGVTVAASSFGLRGFSARAAGVDLSPLLPAGTRAEAILDSLPGKRPLIKLSYRPPNYETPIAYFRTNLTANDAFFVRYHLSNIPEVDGAAWRLTVGGEGASGQTQLALDDLKAMPASEVVGVNQCSGNRRGLFQPHVPGVEWGSGAMGCARWRGVRLKDILDKVGVKKDAIEVVLDGADGPAADNTPDFVKSIPIWKAMEDTTLVAYEMNGQPLPRWNGFPARLVVPGWTGTYWMKHLITVRPVTKPFDGYWMKAAYRIPLGKFPLVARFTSQESDTNAPITEIVVNSLITSYEDGATVEAGKATVGGIAWDGGYDISLVEVSADDGKTWGPATLGDSLGRFAFRPWSHVVSVRRGRNTILVRASNAIGQTQTASLIPNPAGYYHNLVQTLTLNAA